jgi:tetratricopeptide (TPR) repeat protein
MSWTRRVLIAIIVVELAVGGALAARRLARPHPPQADWSLLDQATATQIRAAIAECKSAADWRNLGEMYMAAGCFAESERCHHVACDLDPNSADFARQWAFALERLAAFDAANAQYRRAMELGPDDADARGSKAALYRGTTSASQSL